MSFPLAQDVGYDPSIYTDAIDNHHVLVRDVISEGQAKLRVGVIKPISFRVTQSSILHLKYEVRMSGAPGRAEFIVGTESGRNYSTAIPGNNGEHAIDISGSMLRIPASGAEVQVLVTEADTANAVLGSHSRLIVDALNIEAERRSALPVLLPHLARSATMQMPVALDTVEANNPILTVQLGQQSGKAASLPP